MRKKVLMIAAAGILAVSAPAALLAMKGWHVINDSGCNKCVITDVERKCGKCGGFLESKKKKKSNTKGVSYEATFTCKKCKHSAIGGC